MLSYLTQYRRITAHIDGYHCAVHSSHHDAVIRAVLKLDNRVWLPGTYSRARVQIGNRET